MGAAGVGGQVIAGSRCLQVLYLIMWGLCVVRLQDSILLKLVVARCLNTVRRSQTPVATLLCFTHSEARVDGHVHGLILWCIVPFDYMVTTQCRLVSNPRGVSNRGVGRRCSSTW